MTNERKKEIVELLKDLLTELEGNVERRNETALKIYEKTTSSSKSSKVEMLTLKECTEVIHGLSEHTVRQLVKQGKVKSIRTGRGNCGKILVNKDDLISYFAM